MKQKLLNRNLGMRGLYQLAAALFAAGMLLLNVLASLLAARMPFGVDLTKNAAFNIGADTKAMLAAISKPVTINVLAREEVFSAVSAYNAQAVEIFKQYPKYGDAKLRFVDYVRDPTFTARFAATALKLGDVIVECGERYKLVKTEELFNYAMGERGEAVIASSRAEQAISAAILAVTSDERVSVSVLTGSGEAEKPALLAMLSDNNYEVLQQNLVTESIDSRAKIAIVVAPATDASEAMLQKIDDFLYNGGAYGKILFYCADAEQPEMKGWNALLGEWGVSVGEGAVFETDENRVYNYHPFYTVANYGLDEYADMIVDAQMPILLPLSKPLEALYEFRGNVSTRVLLTFAKSTGVRPPDAPPEFTARDAEVHGPMPALILSQRSLNDKETGLVKAASYVLVSGSAAMLDDFAIEDPSLTNSEYMLNLLGRLSERNDLIKVQSKSLSGKTLSLTQRQSDVLGLTFMLILPALILAIGVFVWLRRRHS